MPINDSPYLVIADDEEGALDDLQGWSEEAGLRVIRCSSVTQAILAIDRALQDKELIGVISDLKITGQTDDGWGVLGHAYKKSKGLRLALFTGWGDEPVHDLFRSGAAVPSFTVFRKNSRVDEVKLQDWLRAMRESWNDRIALTLKDADTRRIYETIAPIYARSTLSMLLLGESGTGKESLARYIHETSRREGQMLSINCGGLEPSLAFSELFGHTANAFTDADYHELGLVLRASGYKPGPRQRRVNSAVTFAEWLREGNPDLREDANGWLDSQTAENESGTLFLDEVATLPRKVMAGLLRVLSTSDVSPFGHYGPGIRASCRIIAATNEMAILERSLAQGGDETATFRRDLSYRLGGAILTLPPLRDRDPEDIRNYVEKTVWGQLSLQERPVDAPALDYVVALYKGRTDDTARQYQLGNFRTLKNLMHRAALIAAEDNASSVTLAHVELSVQHGNVLVDEADNMGQAKHIRETFRRALQKRGISIAERFSWEELRDLTNREPIVVGYAFLCCSVTTKLAPGRGYYQSSEIQRAMTHGLALNTWLGKSLSREHVLKAATEHFGIEASTVPPDIQVSTLVQRIRESSHERYEQ